MSNNNNNNYPSSPPHPIDSFKVYVRIRPFLDRELTQLNQLYNEDPIGNKNITKPIVAVENNTLYLKDPYTGELYGKNVKAFPFDRIFTEKDNNKSLFDKIIKKLIDNILVGYNSTALAYGVTGTGKTHTMFGDIYKNLNFEKGICMYAVDYLFSKINIDTNKSFITRMSYLEIYNEQVIDLLTTNPSSDGIMIVEDPNKGVIVPELTSFIVSDSNQVLNYIMLGNSRRTMGATGVNQFSSRSHAILEINVEQRISNKNKEEIINGKILMVDLAGSERGGLEKGIRREEGSNINKSLLALGNCINILADKTKKGSFVPYRDSKLTRLLKDSLGGNIATLMIACVSPSTLSYEETNSTLKYASRANKIEKKISRNIKEVDQYTAQYREIIVSLKNEIVQLKDIIKNQHLLMKLQPSEDNNNKSKGMFCGSGSGANNKFLDTTSYNSLGSGGNEKKENNISVYKNTNEIYEDFFNEDELIKLDIYDKVTQQDVVGGGGSGDNNNNNNNNNNEINITSITNPNNTFINNNNDLSTSSSNLNIPKPLTLNCNYEVYDNFLNTDLNNLTVEEFEEFEKKMEELYFDKITLEERIKKGIKDSEINEKYTIIRTFYEKFIELINDKLVENIEQNLILKFNLKEILDLNEVNNTNLKHFYNMLNSKQQPSQTTNNNNNTCNSNSNNDKINEDIANYKKNIEENELEKKRIQLALDKNMKIKALLKKLLIKFISNTQMKEIKELQENYTTMLNEKKELEVKNKKYQEFLAAVMKEKEEKSQKIFEISNELEKMKRLLHVRDKRAKDLEKKLHNMEYISLVPHMIKKKKIKK